MQKVQHTCLACRCLRRVNPSSLFPSACLRNLLSQAQNWTWILFWSALSILNVPCLLTNGWKNEELLAWQQLSDGSLLQREATSSGLHLCPETQSLLVCEREVSLESLYLLCHKSHCSQTLLWACPLLKETVKDCDLIFVNGHSTYYSRFQDEFHKKYLGHKFTFAEVTHWDLSNLPDLTFAWHRRAFCPSVWDGASVKPHSDSRNLWFERGWLSSLAQICRKIILFVVWKSVTGQKKQAVGVYKWLFGCSNVPLDSILWSDVTWWILWCCGRLSFC